MAVHEGKDWKFQDVLKATSLIRSLSEALAEAVTASLAFGLEPGAITDMSPESIAEGWKETMLDGEYGPDDIEHFAATVDTYVTIALEAVNALGEALVLSGMLIPPMPDPDTVVIPDTIEGIV